MFNVNSKLNLLDKRLNGERENFISASVSLRRSAIYKICLYFVLHERYATSMRCPSVRLSVTLVDCDHIVHQEVENGAMTDRPVSWLYDTP